MKIIVTAIALAFATSAAAQTAPQAGHAQHPASPPAGHAQHHAAGGHAGHQPAAGQHQGHAMAEGCCADRNGNGQMDCCENMAAGSGCAAHARPAPAQPGQSQGHQNH